MRLKSPSFPAALNGTKVFVPSRKSRFVSKEHGFAFCRSVVKSILISLLLLLCFPLPFALAQGVAKPLSLDDCIRLAEAAPSSFTRARLQTEIARKGITGAYANFLPQLSIANTFTYNSPLLYGRQIFSFIALNGVHEYSSLATSTLDIDTSGRLLALLQRARANRDAAHAGLVLSKRDLGRAVTASYYRVLLVGKLVSSAQDNLREATAFEDRVRRLVQDGESSNADLVKASLETALLQHAVEQSSLEQQLANHDLASFWTSDVDKQFDLSDTLDSSPAPPEPSAVSATQRPYLQRPEFNFLEAQAAGYRADAHQARAQLLPQLSLAFQYGIDAQHVTIRDRGYAGYARLNIPVFDWFRARSAQRQYELQAAQVNTDRDIARRTFSKEYQDALVAVSSAFAQIEVTERQLGLAKENLRLSRVRYEGGEGTALDVVTAQTQHAQASIDFYTARANYLNGQSILKVASGQ